MKRQHKNQLSTEPESFTAIKHDERIVSPLR